MFPKILSFVLTSATGAAAVAFVPVPCRCTVNEIQAACSVDPGDAEVITVSNKAADADVGTLTFGTAIAAGEVGVWADDADDSYQVFEKGDVIKISITATTAAAVFTGYIDIDEYARTSG